MADWLRVGFEADLKLVRDMGLPGAGFEIAFFHYALDGLLPDQLTTPVLDGVSSDAVIERLLHLLPDGADDET